MLHMQSVCLSLAGLLVLGGVATAEHWTDTDDDSLVRGHALVVENCAGCHAVAHVDESMHTQAPPFRTLSERYPIDALEETFIESIDTGHPGMPVFLASPEQIEDILNYIYSVME